MSRGPVLAVPALEPGRGGGHLIRCMALVRELRERGRDARLFLTEGVDVSGIFNTLRFDASWLTAEAELPLIAWDFIVLDRFQTPPEEFERWAGLAPLAGIDEGGPCRDRFDFLIDLLPGLPNRSKPNVADPSLLPLPAEPPRRLPGGGIDAPLKILVSFGHEDAAGLGPAAAKALAAKNNNGVLDITLLRGGLQRNPPLGVCGALAQMIKKMHDFVHFLPFRLLKEPENRGFLRSKAAKIHKSHRLLAACALPGLRALETIPDLGKRLADYDLVITHYGLTAFEAVYAGTPVLLVSPGAYHEKLARAAGFLSAGTGTRGALAIPRLLFKKHRPDRAFLQSLETRRAALAARHSLDRKPEQSLAGLLAGFSPPAGKTCPVCGDAACGAVFGRGPERGFRRCKRCGVIFMRRFNPPSLEYGRDYFFELYQKQYGKTYIEDFPNLTAMAKRRLARIRSLLPSGIGGQGVCGALAQMIKKMHNFVHFLPCRLPKEPKNRGFLRSKAA
ncbi:MAG: hypothetical protein LBG57_03710, partial [Treponema sp.]|nr:hypothetical protein [Treponema sp.]